MKKIGVLLVVTIFCASISSFNAWGQEGVEAVKVGILLPYKGPSQGSGPALRKGVELATKQMAQAGFEIMLIHEDSETSVAPAKKAAKKLVEADKVVAVVGAVTSGVTKAVAEDVTGPNNILMISPSSTSPELTMLPADEGKDLLFRTCPSDMLQGFVLGGLAANRYKTASVMYVDNSYGRGLAEQFKKSFEKRGGRVLRMVPHAEDAVSYTAELKRALDRAIIFTGQSSKTYTTVGPDVLGVFSYTGHAKVYVKEAVESFLFKSFLFCDGPKSELLVPAVGAENLEGMMGTAPGHAGGEPYMNFLLSFKLEYGEIASTSYTTANAYDAMAVIGLAAYAARVKGLQVTGESIRDHLRVVANPPGESIVPGDFEQAFMLLNQGKAINYEGATGTVDFDEKGDVITPIEVWQFSNGKIVTKRMEYRLTEE
jgi:ABC-type branched-subunit amino acid transport system substrate-binding protein